MNTMCRKILMLFVILPYFSLFSNVLSPPCDIPAPLNYFFNCLGGEDRKLNLTLVSKNAYGRCKLEVVALFYDYPGDPTLPQARKMITTLTDRILKDINEHEELACYFQTFPLKPSNLVIRIRMHPKYCGFYYPPLGNIAYATVADGLVMYDTWNSFTYDVDRLRTEPLVLPKPK